VPRDDSAKHLTQVQRNALALKAAHGRVHLLAVGVGENLATSKFPSLKLCVEDAVAVWTAFTEVKQLNAELNRCTLLTTKTNEKPSRGVIIAKLDEVAKGATAEDRLVFFFSGHGHRIGANLCLVPSDAYDADDPNSFVTFDRVVDILNQSDAKQKIIILDACFSGPDTKHLKLLPDQVSVKFLTDYLARTTGVVVLTSSDAEQTSTIKSPNPKLSLFTHFLVKGLHGEASAMQGQFLTVPSLFAYVSEQVTRTSKSHGTLQTPSISQAANGVIMLADFTPRIMGADEVDLTEAPVTRLEFEDSSRQDVREILTKIKNWQYSIEWIEQTANGALGNLVKEDLGGKRVALRRALGWTPADVFVEDAGLTFPSGSYAIEYQATDKKTGRLVYRIMFEPEWFEKSELIPKVIDALDMSPTDMRFVLSKPCEPMTMLPGLEASGWKVTSELDDKIEATRSGYQLTVTDAYIELGGLIPSDIFGSTADKAKARLAMSVVALLPA